MEHSGTCFFSLNNMSRRIFHDLAHSLEPLLTVLYWFVSPFSYSWAVRLFPIANNAVIDIFVISYLSM